MNIAANLEAAARFFPQQPALIENHRTLSFAEFDAAAGRVAAALCARGLSPGQPVAFCAPNSAQWLITYFGVLKAGAVAVTFSHLLTAAELEGVLADCRPRFVFTTEEKLPAVEGHFGADTAARVILPGGELSFETLAAGSGPGMAAVDRDRDDTAAILYTGGTTGTPKGAMLSHANLQAAAFNVAFHERSVPADRALCCLPLNHVFAQVHITHATVLSAGALVLQPGFELEAMLAAVERHRVTKLYAVPTIYIRLLAIEDLERRIASVRYCFSAAASMATEVVREWRRRTGLAIHEAYGMTESASMVTYNHYHRHVVGSVGTPVSLVEVQIRDLQGRRLAAGEQGEICIRGPNVTAGYLNQPEQTRAAFWQGGWFRSGDLGYFDEQGYLFIVDRLKDMIITGGENVYPREVEEVLYAHPQVRECAVVGLPDAEYGERVTAFVVPAGADPPPADALRAFCRQRLAGFKVPKAFHFVDELPKSGAGKLLKREIRRLWGEGGRT